jgi:hypothetical protein
MKKIIRLLLLGLLGSCANTGYQPHYIISESSLEEPPQEEIR